MGIHQRGEYLDTFGMPDLFASGVYVEDAGGGNVRQINYVKRCGVLVPVAIIVRPAESVVAAAPHLLALCNRLTGVRLSH